MTLKAAGKNSENDDRKTFISSTERQAESTLNRSKNKQVNKPSFRVKRVNKKFEYNSKGSLIASHTPEKTSYKSSENKIIITKRKVSGVRDNEETRPMPLYTSKQTNNILTPLIVWNGVNAGHRHYKSKDAFTLNDRKLKIQNQKSYKHIYSKPVCVAQKSSSITK